MKQWTQPKLRIITRARADERILADCKGGTEDGPGKVEGKCKSVTNLCGLNCSAHPQN